MNCKCSLCQDRREFLDRLQGVPVEHHEYFEGLFDKYDDVKAVADYYQMKYHESLKKISALEEIQPVEADD